MSKASAGLRGRSVGFKLGLRAVIQHHPLTIRMHLQIQLPQMLVLKYMGPHIRASIVACASVCGDWSDMQPELGGFVHHRVV